MKKVIFLAVALVVSVCSAWAQTWTDQGTLEISPALQDGEFANGTVFYTISQKGGGGSISVSSLNGGYIALSGTYNDANARWAIIGNSTDGFQFVNKATKKYIKCDKAADANRSSNTSASTFVTTGGTYFDIAKSIKTTEESIQHYVVKIHGDGNHYWNKQNNRLAIWNSAEGYVGWNNSGNGDDGSKFAFTKVESIVATQYSVVISGAPAGETPQITVDGNNYGNGATFTLNRSISSSDVEASDYAGYQYEVTITANNVITVTYSEQFPSPFKQYIIGNAGGSKNLYIVLAPGDDSQGDASNATQASLTTKAGATPFTFTASGNGFKISTVDGETTKYLGANGGWNVGTTQQTVWTLVKQSEGIYALNRGGSNNLGTDNLRSGAGLYTDKAVSKNGKWFLEEYIAPTESHNVYVYLDGATDGQKMNPGDEGEYVLTLIGLSAGTHTVSVKYDENEPVSGTFTSTATHDKITVHYKDGVITFENDVVVVEIGETGYATLYSDKDINFAYSGTEVYVLSVDQTAENLLHAERVEAVKARTGVVIKGEANSRYEFTHITNDSEATSVLEGVLEDTTVSGDNYYVFSKANGNVGFYKFVGTTLKANKAYYHPTSAKVQGFAIDFGNGVVTSISSILQSQSEKGSYDLQGRRVSAATRGLFIQNGVKVIR